MAEQLLAASAASHGRLSQDDGEPQAPGDALTSKEEWVGSTATNDIGLPLRPASYDNHWVEPTVQTRISPDDGHGNIRSLDDGGFMQHAAFMQGMPPSRPSGLQDIFRWESGGLSASSIPGDVGGLGFASTSSVFLDGIPNTDHNLQWPYRTVGHYPRMARPN